MRKTDRQTAVQMLDALRARGVSDTSMLQHIIYNFMSGAEAVEVLKDLATENDIEEEEITP